MEAPFGLEEVSFQTASVAKKPFVEIDLGSSPWKGMPLHEAVKTTDEYVEARTTSITSKYLWLGEATSRHAPILTKRWEKYGKKKGRREKVLSEAWGGDMQTTTLSTSTSSFKDNVELSIRRDVWLCPYINKDALSGGTTLLQLLSARAKHDPIDFFATDLAAMDLSSSNIADCLPESVKDHVLCIRKTGSADVMVELVSSKIIVDGVDRPARLGLAEGLLVLEVSDRILTFATDVVKGIMHDIPVAKLLDYPVTDIDIATIQEDADVKSLARSTAELPYKAPAVANIESLISLLAAARDTAADHIHSLREDPQNYEFHVQERASYEPEFILDVLGRSVARLEGEGSVWMKGVAVELVASHLDLERWSALHDQAVEVHILQQKGISTADNNSIGLVPQSLSFAILKFRDFALSFAEEMTDDLLALVLRSPIMKDYVRFDVERKELTRRQGYKAGKAEELLLEMCKSLSNRAPGCLKQGKVYPVHEFQRLVDMDEAVADIIPERVERQVSDIGLVTECIRQIQLLQPLSRSFADEATAQQGALDAEYAVFQKNCQKIEESFSVGAHNSGELGVPQGKKFLYPVDKRRTQKIVERMRESEHNLDVHWRAVDEIVERLEKNIGGTACWQDFIKPRSLARTPEWSVDSTSKPKAFLPPPGSNIYDPQLVYLSQDKPRDLPLLPKTKEKTRGTAQPPEPRNVEVPAEPVIEPSTIEVDQRALDVFQTLFYTPDLPGKPGETPWTELLYAMTYIGFNAEQLYGSVWHFSSPTLGKGFHFHQPHPQPRIPYRKVRRYGRTLQRALGWDSSTFQLL